MRKQTPYINAHEQISHEIYLCIFKSQYIHVSEKKKPYQSTRADIAYNLLKYLNLSYIVYCWDDVVHCVLD